MWLALIVWLFTAVTVGVFVIRRWWFPEPINALGREFDSHFLLTLAVVGAIFVCAQAALGWAILRFRDRGAQPTGPSDNPRLELLWTAAAAVLFIGLAAASTSIWAGVHMTAPSPNALRVEALAKQFAWSFRYAGPDGKFGRTAIRFINDSTGNPFGIDDLDPAGADDIVTPTLRVPADTPVELTLHGRDVIHSFFVRELRLKQDVVPGMDIRLPFLASKRGEYEIACAELCGLGHHQMRGKLAVMTREEFDQWQQQMIEQLRQQRQ